MNKKKIPIFILKAIDQARLDNNFVDLIIIKPQNGIVEIYDTDYEFYYKIHNISNRGGKTLYDYSCSPSGSYTIKTQSKDRNIDLLSNSLSAWIKLLKDYNEITFPVGDPIIESFCEEYYAEFEILDEDSNIKPFQIDQILLLNDHLENLQKVLPEFIDNREIEEEINGEIENLKQRLPSETKQKIVKALSYIYAKISKYSIGFIQDFHKEGRKEAIKQLVKSGINYIKDNLPDLTQL